MERAIFVFKSVPLIAYDQTVHYKVMLLLLLLLLLLLFNNLDVSFPIGNLYLNLAKEMANMKQQQQQQQQQ